MSLKSGHTAPRTLHVEGDETSKIIGDSLETPRSKRWLLTRSEEQ
jgi:hypothetical protein